ncbi:hypothetical protein, partial [Veronia pacifica]
MRCSIIASALIIASAPLGAVEFQGELGIDHRYFTEKGQFGQGQNQTSFSISPELYWENNDGDVSFLFKPFYRRDNLDGARSHGDIREAMLTYYSDNYEWKAGIGKVFWGVTESQHLVDVINQSDFVESIDGEVKLGQPMLSLGAETETGFWEVFVLPYFRERTYADKEGRLSLPGFAELTTRYESSREEQHTDIAVRYTTSFGDTDLGLSAFKGTNRDPFLQPSVVNGQVVPSLYYAQMTQFGVDLQTITGSWLWKLEAITRDSLENHHALVAGFEYSMVTDTGYDVGLLAEYLYDDRDGKNQVIWQNDIFAGIRWALNDVDGTELLVGGTVDTEDSDSTMLSVE